MNTILVPTHLSPASQNAADYAAHLCRTWNSKMLLLNVALLPAPVSDFPLVNSADPEIQAEFEKVLAREAARLYETFDIEVGHRVETGIPDMDIAGTAEEMGADLVVMGMHHADKLDKMLGSTINGVIRRSRTPILAIPEAATFTPPATITYATDLSYPVTPHHFSLLNKMASSFGSAIQLLHVQKPDSVISQEDIGAKLKLEMNSGLPEHTYYTVEDKDVEDGIQHFLETHPSDILVMTSHKHRFLERLFGKIHTKTMLYRTKIPLLILPDRP